MGDDEVWRAEDLEALHAEPCEPVILSTMQFHSTGDGVGWRGGRVGDGGQFTTGDGTAPCFRHSRTLTGRGLALLLH